MCHKFLFALKIACCKDFFKHASCTLLGIQNGNRKIMISAVNGLYFLKMNYSFGKKEKNGNFVSHQ